MEYVDSIDAWWSDNIDELKCPSCGSPVHMSWNDCECGLELNVEKLLSSNAVYLLTIEHNDMKQLDKEAHSIVCGESYNIDSEDFDDILI
jgi:uncharacterized OB-fold protein